MKNLNDFGKFAVNNEQARQTLGGYNANSVISTQTHVPWVCEIDHNRINITMTDPLYDPYPVVPTPVVKDIINIASS